MWYAINASKWQVVCCSLRVRGGIAGEKEQTDGGGRLFRGCWLPASRLFGHNNFRDPRERSRICRPGSDWECTIPACGLRSHLLVRLPLPVLHLTVSVPCPIPQALISLPRPPSCAPPLPALLPPEPVPSPPFPCSPYAPYCLLGRPSPQQQGAAKISPTVRYGRIGENEGCEGHSSMSRRPWLRACQPNQQHVPV